MWDCIADDSLGKDVWHDPAFKIYRGLGNLVLLVYMWGVNIWVWKRFGIDYERCLSLDPKGPRVDPCEQQCSQRSCRLLRPVVTRNGSWARRNRADRHRQT
ncbi:unnamed protein product [Ectocarpus sp. 12 AP-2014]